MKQGDNYWGNSENEEKANREFDRKSRNEYFKKLRAELEEYQTDNAPEESKQAPAPKQKPQQELTQEQQPESTQEQQQAPAQDIISIKINGKPIKIHLEDIKAAIQSANPKITEGEINDMLKIERNNTDIKKSIKRMNGKGKIKLQEKNVHVNYNMHPLAYNYLALVSNETGITSTKLYNVFMLLGITNYLKNKK